MILNKHTGPWSGLNKCLG